MRRIQFNGVVYLAFLFAVACGGGSGGTDDSDSSTDTDTDTDTDVDTDTDTDSDTDTDTDSDSDSDSDGTDGTETEDTEDTETEDTDTSDTSSSTDSETVDTETVDTETVDTETVDTETVDTETVDTETADTETEDTETVDTETVDTETVDTDTVDTDTVDTDTVDTDTVDTDTLVDSDTIPRKYIRMSSSSSGNITGGYTNAVAGADALCPPGYLAIFTDGVNRIASVTPNTGDGQVNWVLQPFTAYYRWTDDELIFVTDEAALLGVTDGAAVDLITFPWMTNAVWTGFNQDWTASTTNCNGWTTGENTSSADMANGGMTDRRFLRIGTNTCDWTRPVYCAEQ